MLSPVLTSYCPNEQLENDTTKYMAALYYKAQYIFYRCEDIM